jgi:photosystem II stability/assembly factor-like uncharacterized protein
MVEMLMRARSFGLALASLVVQFLVAQPVAASCNVLVFDEATPGTVYLGFSTFGELMKSADEGRTWVSSGSFYTLSSIVIDPRNSNTLYAGAHAGVMKSTNGGKTWEPTGLAGLYISVLAIDPRMPAVLFARASKSGIPDSKFAVYKSVDGGAHWTKASAGLPAKGYGPIRFSRDRSDVLYSGTTTGFFKTTDSGKRWKRSGTGLEERAISDVVIDAHDPETVYVAASASRKAPAGVFKSINGGQTWTNISAGLPRADVMALAGDPSHSGVVYAGTGGQGLYRTTDAGARWTRVALPSTYPCNVAVSPHDSQVILAVTGGSDTQGYSTGIYKTMDGGARWEVLRNGLPSVSSIVERSDDEEKVRASMNHLRTLTSQNTAAAPIPIGAKNAAGPTTLDQKRRSGPLRPSDIRAISTKRPGAKPVSAPTTR